MIRVACIGAALATLVAGAAFADTPIGPGVTGFGGTGANETDFSLHAGAGGEGRLLRHDRMPADHADVNMLASAGALDRYAALRDISAVGASDSSAAGGSVGATIQPTAQSEVWLPGHLLD